jgi:heme exporter protein A
MAPAGAGAPSTEGTLGAGIASPAPAVPAQDPPAAARAETAITAHEVWRGFGRERVLRGVTVEVPPGAGLAIFGPNGSGKSTLLRVLAGLLRPARGTVLVGGDNLYGVPSARRRIGYVGHEPMLYGGLTVAENLRLFATLYGLDAVPARINTVCTLLGLRQYGDVVTARLSRGLLQRTAIARALLHAPAVLLLDEPFAGLDPDAAAHLAAHLDEFRQRGGALVLATHQAAEAARAADEARVLRNGRLSPALRLAGLDAAVIEGWYRNAGEAAR